MFLQIFFSGATLLAEAGYQLFDALEPGTDRVPLDTPVENTLAVPC